MSNLVIVAIPEEQDRVWKISSEQVPHLTLLFLGDEETADTQQIMQFVEHAAQMSEHGPFYLDVDKRGVLGEDEADVVFFSKRSWNLKWIRQFRGQLLQNPAVRTAYDSTEQFEEWTPHLTLGYPETPAKEPEDDRGDHLYSVCFDRIAVWDGNYEGPEFELEWPERELEGDLAVAWSDEMKKALQHHGVKGMKWGVRRENKNRKAASRFNSRAEKLESDNPGAFLKVAAGPKALRKLQAKQDRRTAAKFEAKANKIAAKREQKADKKWEKDVFTPKTWVDIHNAGAEHVNSKIDGINASFEKKHPKEMKDGTLLNDSHPVTREYHKAYNDTFVVGLNQGAAKLPKSPSGKYKVKIVSENHDSISEFGWGFDREKIEHAASDELIITFMAKRNDKGIITSVEPVIEEETTLAQAMELGEEFLEHYGKKGMRWGHRTERREDRAGGRDPKRLAILAGKAKSGAKKTGSGLKQVAKDVHFETDWAKDTATRKVVDAASTSWAEKDVPRLNAEYKGTKGGSVGSRLKNPLAKETIEYRGRSRAAYRDRLNEEVTKLPGNASGTRKYTIEDGGKSNANYVWKLKAVDAKRSSGLDHAATDEPPELLNFAVQPTLDKDGFIIGFKQVPMDDTLEQGEEFVEGLVHSVADVGEAFIIEHYGIKGMRWGFRRERPSAVTPTATSRVPHGNRRKTKIETEGGQNHPAHEDAIKVAQAKVKLKKSGTAALSNKELQDVANRVQLEERVKLLTSSKGKRFVKGELETEGKNLAKTGAKKAAKSGIKKAGTALLV